MKILACLAVLFVGSCQGHSLEKLPARATLTQCQAPNGGGLEPVIGEILEMVMQEKVLSIILTAMTNDKQVQDVLTYITSDDGLNHIEKILESYEIHRIIDFSCKELHLDLVFYINEAGHYLGLPPFDQRNIKRSTSTIQRTGIQGVIRDVIDAIGVDKLKTFAKDKLDNDEYVRLAIKTLHSDEGQRIFKNLLENMDIKKLLEDLVKLGLDLLAVIEDIKKLFGW
ncbi:unnamed protein product [Hermetia illucens]|uniref:Uncharacterized protein n=1 Tax=Hermetia illucens TaxID=343691 RepID=A0A7R8UT74_HERIL|nr:unnamed protein product [Hermetia illucens]